MIKKRILIVLTVLLVLLAIPTSTIASLVPITVAAFANPSPGSDNPLFTVDFTNDTISGGWTDAGLTLEIPVGNASYNNATFIMSQLQYTFNDIGGAYTTGGGTIIFKDTFDTPVLTISFNKLWLESRQSGMNAINGDGVIFEGPDFGILTYEAQFGFTFANTVDTQDGYTATGSFDSSAVVPEPATILLLGSGFLVFVACRKK